MYPPCSKIPKCGQTKHDPQEQSLRNAHFRPLSIPIFYEKFSCMQDLRNVLQFASGSCYKLRTPTITTKCCNPCNQIRRYMKSAATLYTKCTSYNKMPHVCVA